MSVPRERLKNCGFTPLTAIYVRSNDSKRFRKCHYTSQLGKSLEQSDQLLEIRIPTEENVEFVYRMDAMFHIYELREIIISGKRVCIFKDSSNNLLKMPYKHKPS